MTFYVYKATGRLSKNVWELVSELDNYDDAVAPWPPPKNFVRAAARLKPNRATAYRKLISVLTITTAGKR